MYEKFVKRMKEEGFMTESIEVAGKALKFRDTKAGKLHMEFVDKLLQSKQADDTIMTSELRELLSSYLAASETAIVYNMKAYLVMQQLIEGLLLTKCMADTGKIVSVTFPEQVEVLQKSVDKMLTLIGRKINHETTK